ncbi:trehalase-like domain-containing protein [Streptomyces sp. NPDC056400]|uniref:trehalase-like domain-containing protein n=1 Tax=Streptomyces sp. NPDC056400 TaxID=3345808 RepID=UPI0035D6E0BF
MRRTRARGTLERGTGSGGTAPSGRGGHLTGYPPIADHGMVDDLQTAALVAADGTIDWWCTPRFDSPSVFASILDRERGGDCRFSADLRGESGATIRQLYLSGTTVLVNRYLAPGGVGEVADFMVPVEGTAPTTRHRLVRVARVVRGRLPFTFSCRPRFDYGRAPHALDRTDDHAAVLRGPGTDLHVQVTAPAVLHADGDDLTADFTLAAGKVAAVVLTSVASGEPDPAPPSVDGVTAELEACRAFWLSWLCSSTYRGRWYDMVNRSAGHPREPVADHVPDRRRSPPHGGGPRPPGGVGGLVTRPRRQRRCRSGAARHLRRGDAMARGHDMGDIRGWKAFSDVLDWLADHWDRTDEGIWETRGGQKDFTYSRLMTWVAFDRGIRLAAAHSRPADIAHWTEVPERLAKRRPQRTLIMTGFVVTVAGIVVLTLGSSLGTAVAGTILVAGLTSGAYAAALITLAVIGLVGLAAAVLLPAKPPPA